MTARRHAGGFTLLEAMVTLVIVSLMIALLMQALIQVLGLRERVLLYQRESRTAALQEQWFRESVQGALVDLPDALGRMEGDAERFGLVTASPLATGGIGYIGWSIVRQGRGQVLSHTDSEGNSIEVIGGPMQDARFSYRSAEGEWTSSWQPEEGATEVVPRLIRFTATGTRNDIDWVVPLLVDPRPAAATLRPENELGI